MAGEAFVVGQFDAANFQGHSFFEFMGVPAVTNPHKLLPLMNADDADLKRLKMGLLWSVHAYAHGQFPILTGASEASIQSSESVLLPKSCREGSSMPAPREQRQFCLRFQ